MMLFNYPPGSTPLDHDEASGLIPGHLTNQTDLNAWEEENIFLARQWAAKQKNIISVDFMQKLHYKMFAQTWKWAGSFRRSEKNIGIDWLYIATRLKELCDNVQYQIDHEVYSLDEICTRFHHAIVFIHPFSNGNGRHARLMADLVLQNQGCQPFSWGMHQEIYTANPVRLEYIKALQAADSGNFTPLLEFVRS